MFRSEIGIESVEKPSIVGYSSGVLYPDPESKRDHGEIAKIYITFFGPDGQLDSVFVWLDREQSRQITTALITLLGA